MLTRVRVCVSSRQCGRMGAECSLCGNLMQRTDDTVHFESTDSWGKAVQSLPRRDQNVQQIYERGSTATEEHLEGGHGERDCHTSNNTQQCTGHHSTDAGSWGP